MDFWIEGLEHAAVADIVLECKQNGTLIGDDRVCVMTAPVLFLSNIEEAEKVYVMQGTPLAQSLANVLGAGLVPLHASR